MKNEKYLFIVSGPAGVGKDTVVAAVRAAHPEVERSVTATTRAPRPGEVDGINYHFRTVEAFEKLRDEKLAATPAAIRACAPVLRKVADRGNVCVFGNEDIIRAAKQPLEVTKLF